ncbi:uncharacterized protein PV09_04749 [Verruconis gallopava]|uniref:SURF1-like protein n=1 Tax=Verruconis gallopava TaxID=253628 RepID=A0A0D1XMV2_9PEZI|nr:uncharacterized protein PV09_04749 [Verruconis gallopava]KIW03906.1 hypothetical protein PV09_04749 [Verruconis gallopava]
MNSYQRLGWRCLRCQLGAQSSWLIETNARRQWTARWQQLSRSPSKRHYANPADSPGFHSIVDDPPKLVRAGRKRHGPGIILLALIPVTAFALGTWQVQRLGWKTDLIAKYEDRLTRPPLPLPPFVDPEAVKEFDYRRVIATGKYRHDQEMLVGPRMMEGENGFTVITPLERPNGSTILISRGWIASRFKDQKTRDPSALPTGEVQVQGLLREPFKKNMFTPENNLEKKEFYFPDIPQMAKLVGAQPVWVEETMEPELMETMRRQERGIPVGRSPEVALKNNHAQYIFTWYSLSLATSIMLWMILKKKPSSVTQRVTRNREW